MKNKDKIILDLCGGTAAWSRPFKDAGYTVFNVTLPEYDIKHWMQYPEIKNAILSGKVYGILAAPPCTMFSLARNNAKSPRNFLEGMSTVRACMDIIWMCRADGKLKWWALENPVGYLRQFLGKPAYTFQAWWFGDSIKKPTDLWGYFNEPKKKRNAVKPSYTRKGKGSWAYQNPTPGAKERSITPAGFAKAFYEANR